MSIRLQNASTGQYSTGNASAYVEMLVVRAGNETAFRGNLQRCRGATGTRGVIVVIPQLALSKIEESRQFCTV